MNPRFGGLVTRSGDSGKGAWIPDAAGGETTSLWRSLGGRVPGPPPFSRSTSMELALLAWLVMWPDVVECVFEPGSDPVCVEAPAPAPDQTIRGDVL
jgi:hypothetical protein